MTIATVIASPLQYPARIKTGIAEHLVWLLVATSYMITGRGAPRDSSYLAAMTRFVASRRYFANSPTMQVMVLFQVFLFLFMCATRPGEFDGLFQFALWACIALQYAAIDFVANVAEEALQSSLPLARLELQLPSPPDASFRSHVVPAPKPPPQSLLQVA